MVQESVLEDVHEDGFMYDVVMLAPDVRQEHVPTAREKTCVCVCLCVCVCVCVMRKVFTHGKPLYVCKNICIYAAGMRRRVAKYLERRFGAR